MQITLTESQLKKILAEELIEQSLVQELNESLNLDSLKYKIKKAVVAGIALTTILFAINKLHINNMEKEQLIELAKIEAEQHRQDSLFDVKVEACRKYMEFALGNKNKTLNDTKLKPETLVKCATDDGLPRSFRPRRDYT